MKQGLLLAILFCIANLALAEDFYWVNNGGNWTDYQQHWATNSGGDIMHTRVPEANDNIIFDANSFDLDQQSVIINTNWISCSSLDFSAVTHSPEVLSNSECELSITNNLYLSNNMSFNYLGMIIFNNSTNGEVLNFNSYGLVLQSDIKVEISTGTLNVLSDLLLPQNQFSLVAGTLNLQNNEFEFKEFNASNGTELVPSQACAILNADVIRSNKSFYLNNLINTDNLEGRLTVNTQTSDSCYLSFGDNICNLYVEITGSNKTFLKGKLQTNDTINLDFGGQLFTENHTIKCDAFISNNPHTRTINLGSTEIFTSSVILDSIGLTLQSENASIRFTNSSENKYNSNKNYFYSAVSIIENSTLLLETDIHTNILNFGQNSSLLLSPNSTCTVNSISHSGNCGNYTTIRSYYDDPYQWPNSDEVSNYGHLHINYPTTVGYFNFAFVEVEGEELIAHHSFNLGEAHNITLSEPSNTDILYWIGGKGNWNDPANWSTTSGGTAQTCVPTKDNPVIFDANSFSESDTLFITQHAFCQSMNWENIASNISISGNGNLYIYNDASLHANIGGDYNGTITFENETGSDNTFTTAKVELNADLVFKGEGDYTIQDSLFLNGNIDLHQGGLVFANDFARMESMFSASDSTKTLDISNTSIELTGTGICWQTKVATTDFTSTNSEITFTNNTNHQALNEDNLSFDDITVECAVFNIYGNNTIDSLNLNNAQSVIFEAGTTTQISELLANGNCENRIDLSTGTSHETATISTDAGNTLSVSRIHISNITANKDNGRNYSISQSTLQGNTFGWSDIQNVSSDTVYWNATNSNWQDIANWEDQDGNLTNCLPTAFDHIIIDTAHFVNNYVTSIEIKRNTYCQSIDFSKLYNKEFDVILSANLDIQENIILDTNLNISYAVAPTTNTMFDYKYGLTTSRDQAYIQANGCELSVNLFTKNEDFLQTGLTIDGDITFKDLTGIHCLIGAISCTDATITTDIFEYTGDSEKYLYLNNSTLNINYYADFSGDISNNTLTWNNSKMVFLHNNYANEYTNTPEVQLPNSFTFIGGDKIFSDVEIFLNDNQDDNTNYTVYFNGNNTIENLMIHAGGEILFQEGSTQTINGKLSANGTCPKPITLASAIDGENFIISKTNAQQDTLMAVHIKDMTSNDLLLAKLSEDIENNTGITFDSQKAANPLFSFPNPLCLDNEIHIENQSTSMYGEMTNLAFEWDLKDISTTTDTHFDYTFTNQGEYILSLLATDTITKCGYTHADTIELIRHDAQISSSIPELTICDGTAITFTASSNQESEILFYRNNSEIASTDEGTLLLNDLSDNDEVFAVARFNGCDVYSDTLEVTVNANPEITFVAEPASAEICAGESITFTATGGDEYLFYIDGEAVGTPNSNNTLTSTTLSNGANISLKVTNTTTGCFTQNTTDITVTKHDNPEVNLTPSVENAIICQGQEISFTAEGANNYEFFINGDSQAEASTETTYLTTSLNDSDIITVEGTDANGCSSICTPIVSTVNPSPALTVTSSDTDNTICFGQEITFTADGASEYQYFINDVAQGDYSSTSELSNAFTNGNQISLIGRIGNCYDTIQEVAEITVNPQISLEASTTEICPGNLITFTASGDTQYQFLIDGETASEMGTENTFSSLDFTNGQAVSVVGTEGACLPEAIEVTVHNLPNLNITTSDDDLSICANQELTFTTSGAELYQYIINYEIIDQPNSNTSYTTSLPEGTNSVIIKATSEHGCISQSEEMEVEVRPLPTVSLSTSDATSICEGTEVSVSANGASSYEFFINGESQGAASATSSFSTSTLENTDIITVEGTENECSNAAPESIAYAVYGIPVVNITASSALSVCEGEEISVTASGASSYEFFVNGESQGAASSQAIFASSTLSDEDAISVIGHQNICQDESDNTIVVDINPIPALSLSTNIPAGGLCLGDAIECTVSGASEYQFFLDGMALNQQGTSTSITIENYYNGQEISVTGSNNSCVRELENPVEILLNRVIVGLTSNLEGVALCESTDLTLTGSGADSYEFFMDGTSLQGPSASNTYTTSANQMENYYVVGTDNATGCSESSAVITTQVFALPEIEANLGAIFCENDSALLTTSDNGNTILWKRDGEIIAQGEIYELYTNQPGEYTIQEIRGQSNQVFAAGHNEHGQLGSGNTIQSESLQLISMSNQVSEIASGDYHNIAMDNNGNVYTWGSNQYGQIGNGTFSDVYTVSQVSLSNQAISVACGDNHSMVLLSDSTIMSWGKNDMGQLGYGNNAASNFPTATINLSSVSKIVAGSNHSVALKSDGTVWAFGSNQYGQLGDGTFTDNNQAVQVLGLSNIVEISAGSNHNLAIDNNGDVWAWGLNSNGQLGIGNNINQNTAVKIEHFHNVVLVAAGQQHSLAYNSLGDTYAWGSNAENQLGNPSVESSQTPVSVSISSVVKLEAGKFSSFAIRSDQSLWAWGQNNNAQLSLGHSNTVSQPTASQETFSAISVSAGANFATVIWGETLSCNSAGVVISQNNVPEITIVQNESTLSVEEGIAWQWLLNGNEIPNATQNQYTVTTSGNYSVQVELENGCTVITDELSISNAVANLISESSVVITPNPASEIVTIDFKVNDTQLSNIKGWEIVSSNGAVVLTSNTDVDFVNRVDISQLKPAVYYVRIISKGDILIKKLVIQ